MRSLSSSAQCEGKRQGNCKLPVARMPRTADATGERDTASVGGASWAVALAVRGVREDVFEEGDGAFV